MPPNHFESEVESFLEGSHGDRTHIKRADHHTVTPLCGTLLPYQTGRPPHGYTTTRDATTPPAAFPRNNSPSTPDNSVFCPFWACWANYFALTPTSDRAGRKISRAGRRNMAALKPTTPLLTLNKAPLKPTTPLRPKTAPQTPISHPHRR